MSGNLSGSQIITELTRIVDSLILDNNPTVLDDEQPDLLQDGDQREEAIDQLQKMIENYKETI
jgi:hypothetical protein